MMKKLFQKTYSNAITDAEITDKIDRKNLNIKILKFQSFSNESFGEILFI